MQMLISAGEKHQRSMVFRDTQTSPKRLLAQWLFVKWLLKLCFKTTTVCQLTLISQNDPGNNNSEPHSFHDRIYNSHLRRVLGLFGQRVSHIRLERYQSYDTPLSSHDPPYQAPANSRIARSYLTLFGLRTVSKSHEQFDDQQNEN